MLALRAASLARAATSAAPIRALAITATVKDASDTSAMKFPAPSHVSIAAEAADLARQLNEFYSNPDSVIAIPDDIRESLRAEVMKKVGAVPDANISAAWANQNLQIPSEIRLGDNPLFESHQKLRDSSK
ncbi:hypothetical protein BWQ96_00920 [Gracilariopsis chorda]|uniref:Uncharacterized protein n=1 Tax=Gracilariopsis chorda TaxID=448386 RepID=A0A2V3J4G5_9FLOR|nr:hypothetical protein BWQ96_00920 [Gracilariopsis chorda]|eukprot:PXF49346.1 hypothetical protein BWQ96_00920 [Gracilariopsis chorda]